MYCEMPKVGSTNWKRVFMKLTNPKYEDVPIEGNELSSWIELSFRMNYHPRSNFFVQPFLEISGGRKYDENGLKKIIDYPAAKRKEMVETYYKFTMVRNPFERLLSGYRDKGWNGYFPDKVRS